MYVTSARKCLPRAKNVYYKICLSLMLVRCSPIAKNVLQNMFVTNATKVFANSEEFIQQNMFVTSASKGSPIAKNVYYKICLSLILVRCSPLVI